jgi:hypothetical protein
MRDGLSHRGFHMSLRTRLPVDGWVTPASRLGVKVWPDISPPLLSLQCIGDSQSKAIHVAPSVNAPSSAPCRTMY